MSSHPYRSRQRVGRRSSSFWRGGGDMSEEPRRHDMAIRRVVYELPGADAAGVRRDVPYRETGAGVLAMDVYAPPEARPGARTPAVVFVLGYSDAGARAMLGCSFKEMGSFVSWAR